LEDWNLQHGNGFQLTVAYSTDTSIVDVAGAIIPSGVAERNSTFDLNGIYPFDDVKGKVVVGRTDSISTQPTGLFNFTLATARLEPQTIRPAIQGISSFRLITAGGTPGARLYGDIELVAGRNMQFSSSYTSSGATILISAISGEGTVEECLCEGESAPLPCIRTINGIPGTPDGNFSIVGDNCLTIAPESNGIKITNVCAQPCCGCEELAKITAELEAFRAQRSTLEHFVTALEAESRAFSVTVLGARLGDRNCQNCDG
jgi:hypothetical protein